MMDIQSDYESIFSRLSELRMLLDATIRQHSKLLKAADKANWDMAATEQADAALAEMRSLKREFDDLLQLAEQKLTADGVAFLEEAESMAKHPERWWKKDINRDLVPVTGHIEDALEAGLELLINRLPKSWWMGQQNLRESVSDAYLRESVALCGLVPAPRLPDSINRYAYALMLARDSQEKREHYDIYEGALLVPIIAALCTLLSLLGEVKGGYEKLDELVKAPSGEIDSRLYEIVVAARCAALGREVEFLAAGSTKTPDLRIHDLGFPAVVECKMQSRLSDYERKEFAIMQEVFHSLTTNQRQHGLMGSLSISSNLSFVKVGIAALVESSLRCTNGINPYKTIQENWGSVSFEPLAPTTGLTDVTRLYSPDFLKQVFEWDFDSAEYDGLCGLVENSKTMMVDRADFPFCLKWKDESENAISTKSRSTAGLLKQAFDQVPVGEAGFIYVAYEETHRVAIADYRTQRHLDLVAKWEIRKRGINPQLIIVNRLYPSAIHEGRPNLIESAIPTGFIKENVYSNIMPTSVFVEAPTE